MKRQKLVRLATTVCVLAVAANCFAAGSSTGMPWEGPLEMILSSITGPVAKVFGVLAIALTGLAMAYSEGGGMMKKMLNVVMGLCIAFSASSFFLSFFGYGSGLGF
jgi:type IV secretion system protein TrbC